jgi:Phage integrase family
MAIHPIAAQSFAYELAQLIEKNFGATMHSRRRTSVQPTSPTSLLPSKLRVSEMPREYERINATVMATKSGEQLRKWRVARATSVATFIKAAGSECLVSELNLQHAHTLHHYWQQRVLSGKVCISSANRLMRNFTGLYSAIHNYYRLECRNPFAGLHLRGGRDGKRLAYSTAFVRDVLLAEGALESLNPEARRIIYLIIETGLRPSEACALDAACIKLESPIPFVRVTDDMRQTKTPGSIRTIPLVGVALNAMRLQPDGFPRYRNRPDLASATINKALTTNGLRPEGRKQTLYSLRHTLVDRLRTAEAPKDIQEDILGHVHMYGEGTSLEHRHSWLNRIALKAPTRI